VQEKQSVTASVYLSSAITLGPWLRPVRTSTLLVLVLRQFRVVADAN